MRDRVAGLVAAALFMGGCGAPEGLQLDPSSPNRPAVWMPTRAALTNAAFPPPGAQLTYYGGKVIASMQAEVVFWGSSVDPTTTSQIAGYFQAVPNSAYFDLLTEYNTNINAADGSAGSNQTITHGGLNAAPVTITPTVATGANLTDAQIQQELINQINAGNLPVPTSNLLYTAYFAPGVSITQGGGASCTAFCGYHGTIQTTGPEIYYAVLPDVATCAGACDFVPADAFASITAITSHEIAEAITDAEVGIAGGLGRPLAWYDGATGHGEIGDLCLAITDQVAGYTVQKEWSNAQAGCVSTGPNMSGGGGGSKSGCGCDLAGATPQRGTLFAGGLVLGAVGLFLRRRRAA